MKRPFMKKRENVFLLALLPLNINIFFTNFSFKNINLNKIELMIKKSDKFKVYLSFLSRDWTTPNASASY